MEYLRYIAVLRQHIVLIVVLVAVGAGSSAYFAFHQPKIYSATATLLINPAVPNQAIPYLQAVNGGGNSLQQLASTYDTYIHSITFDKKVIQDLGLSISPGTLSGEITTAEVGDTNFMRITVVGQDPLFTQRVANGVALTFIAQNALLQQTQVQQENEHSAANAQLAATLQAEINSVQALDAQLSKAPDANTGAAQATLASVEARLNNLIAAKQALTPQSNGSNTQQLNTATLTDPAQLPTLPISPNVRQSIIFGTVLGLALGVVLSFLLDYLDYSMRTPEDVQRSTGQLPLAVISITEAGHTRARGLKGRRRGAGVARVPPALPAQGPTNMAVPSAQPYRNGNGAGSPLVGNPQPNLVTVQSPHDPVSEAFRALRTNLSFSTLDHPARSIAVTSMLPSEGKSTIAANLAAVLAQSGKRVILIDTDLRRPTVHRLFNVKNMNGFTDVLLGNCDLESSLQEVEMVPNLRVLTSGTLPLNPAELLSSDAIVPLIESLRAAAELLIFDTPPMGVLTDAVALSTRLEGTLVVVRAGSSRPNAVANGLESLRKVGVRPLGVVLNMVDVSALRGYSSYYYYYSYYSQGGYYSEPAKEGRVGSVTG